MKMDMPLINMVGLGGTVAAIGIASFRLLSGNPVKLSSTSQELLDLFEVGAPCPSIARLPDAPPTATQHPVPPCGALRNRVFSSQADWLGSISAVRHRWAST